MKNRFGRGPDLLEHGHERFERSVTRSSKRFLRSVRERRLGSNLTSESLSRGPMWAVFWRISYVAFPEP